ncbi:MAG: Na/Pi cotransporter family protein [Anaerostipes sp.]|jgi:phosphate:Na+ symporter|nr:Na/Pi cotransporter family protein [Anaerostipes sp.]
MDYSFILPMIGGLGLFLYGMKLMSDGLENAAGERLRNILEFFTNNRFTGMLVGIFFTAIIQSSSASTVMVVSFVNAGLMNLSQAAGVILGANIGTTVTSQLVAFNLSEVAPIFLIIGVVMVMFIDSPNVKKIGEVVLGFGVLFTGLTTMSSTMEVLKDSPMIMNALSNLDNHFIAVFIGFIITAILQSSSVTVSIVLLMASQGLLALPICFFIILGCNMGSCVSALLASLSGKKNAKRAAMIHFLFNVFGSIIVFTALSLALKPITNIFLQISNHNIGRSVANAHTTFKIIEAIFMFPFMNYIVKLAKVIVPGNDETSEDDILHYIGEKSMITPSSAIPQVRRELIHSANLVWDNLNKSFSAFIHNDLSQVDDIYKKEETINEISHGITDFLVHTNQLDLPISDRGQLGCLFHAVSDVERIGDHAVNFTELACSKVKHKSELSPAAKKQITNMYESVEQVLILALKIFHDRSEKNIPKLLELEEHVDVLERKYQKSHIKRMSKGECEPRAGLLFSDMLSALERISDHGVNIALSITDKYDEEDFELEEV